jgi:hypothetical protein
MIWYLCDNNLQLLLVIHSPNIVTLWNTQTGTKLWRIVYDHQRDTETFLQIIQDPFNHQRAICKEKNYLKKNYYLNNFSTWSIKFNLYRRFLPNKHSEWSISKILHIKFQYE